MTVDSNRAASPQVAADADFARAVVRRIADNIEAVVLGQADAIRKLLAAFVSGGHVLLEDVPGTGKTTLAKALAVSIEASFKRVQFTPDLLPSDILGVSVFDPRDHAFHFHAGPVFANVLLADEINRASPRTQSALLEAMAEGQVSIDGSTHRLERLFFVIATQNPVEFRGTYPLPEAQMDRFAMRLSLGYLPAEAEAAMLAAHTLGRSVAGLAPCATLDELTASRNAARNVRIAPELVRYVVDLLGATRSAPDVRLGASARGGLALLQSAQALALIDGEEFVHPEHLRELLVPVLAHRLALDPQARYSGVSADRLVAELGKRVPVPF